MSKLRILLAVFAMLALSVGAATASAGGGNSDNAELCQQDGWEDLVRDDGSPFKNVGDCVSYAAQGGEFGQSPAAGLCASIGGTYSTDPATNLFDPSVDFDTVLWTCNGVEVPNGLVDDFLDACHDSGGNKVAFRLLAPFYNTCGIDLTP